MDFNTLFFPVPKHPSYSIVSHLGDIIYVPKRYELDSAGLPILHMGESNIYIPCIYIQRNPGQNITPKVMFYLHGNAEDLGSCYDIVLKLSLNFKCSVIAMEYPGYGVYKSEESDADKILLNAHLIV